MKQKPASLGIEKSNPVEVVIPIRASAPYKVHVGVGILGQITAPSRQAFVVCQPGSKIHAKKVQRVLQDQSVRTDFFELPDGEAAKTLTTYETLLIAALDAGLERSATVYAVGGGGVGDAAGFFAATFMRGIPVVHVPTTLLAMVDSSIGGKTAINVGRTKNIAGAFWQPHAMVCDVETLATLPSAEMKNGMAEVIKHGLILDSGYFGFVEKNLEKIMSKDPAALIQTVAQSVRIKASVVEKDERESGDRMMLNYGHTVGHGIEAVTGISHGSAISVGMVAEASLSKRLGFLSEKDQERQNKLLEKTGLPLKADFGMEAVLGKMRSDKKRLNQNHRMVLLDRIGACHVESVSENQIQTALEAVLS